MKIPLQASAEIRQSFQEIHDALRPFLLSNINLNGRRFTNAGAAINASDFVTKSDLEARVAEAVSQATSALRTLPSNIAGQLRQTAAGEFYWDRSTNTLNFVVGDGVKTISTVDIAIESGSGSLVRTEGSSTLTGARTISIADGTISAPSLRFASSTNSGIFTAQSGVQMNFVVNGVEQLRFNNNRVRVVQGGTDAAPGLSFTADTNTGLRWQGTDVLSIVTGGVEALQWNASQQTALSISGTAGAPALTRTGNLNTGLFFPATSIVGISAGASEVLRFNSSQRVLLASDGSAANPVIATQTDGDTGLVWGLGGGDVFSIACGASEVVRFARSGGVNSSDVSGWSRANTFRADADEGGAAGTVGITGSTATPATNPGWTTSSTVNMNAPNGYFRFYNGTTAVAVPFWNV